MKRYMTAVLCEKHMDKSLFELTHSCSTGEHLLYAGQKHSCIYMNAWNESIGQNGFLAPSSGLG